jgi:hypothetical protein
MYWSYIDQRQYVGIAYDQLFNLVVVVFLVPHAIRRLCVWCSRRAYFIFSSRRQAHTLYTWNILVNSGAASQHKFWTLDR